MSHRDDVLSDHAPTPVGYTRRSYVWAHSKGRTLRRLKLIWCIGFAVIIAIWVYIQFSSVPAGLAMLVLLVAVAFVSEVFPIFMGLPTAAFFVLLWAIWSVTSVVDLFLYFNHITAVENRMALIVMLINIAVASLCLVVFYW